MADYTININAFVNQPPSTVGDGSQTIDYGDTIVFTRAMLTSMLAPAYSDPEGDPAGQLKIIGLPSVGTLQYNGVDVIVNQIINFTDIDSGLFTYNPDLTETNAVSPVFQFEIADTGSGTFVG